MISDKIDHTDTDDNTWFIDISVNEFGCWWVITWSNCSALMSSIAYCLQLIWYLLVSQQNSAELRLWY